MIYIQLKIMFIMGQKKNDITPGGGVRKFFHGQDIYIFCDFLICYKIFTFA